MSAGGVRPARVQIGAVLSATRVGKSGFQAALNQVSCATYRGLAAEDERVYDVVWRELTAVSPWGAGAFGVYGIRATVSCVRK